MTDLQKKIYGEQNRDDTGPHFLFERQVNESPDEIAIQFNDDKISYADLDRRADLLSQHIIDNDTGSSVIGISTTRNIGMVVGVLAILKAGKAYLPLDPSYPSEHLTRMIKDAGVHICLCPDTEFSFFNSFLDAVQFLSTSAKNTFREIDKPVGSPVTYVMYTSGSSGKPKGVVMGNAALTNLLRWQNKNSIAGRGSKTLQFAPLSFDVSFQEILSILTTGGTLVLVDEDLRLDPLNLLQYVEEKAIQRIFLPFVALQYLAETACSHQIFPASIQEVITAGEQLKCTPQLTRFFSNIPAAVLYNQYGPTETHVATSLKLEGDTRLWPILPSIGKPIDHMEIFILNEKGYLLPNDEPGEICICGTGLAVGYLNQPALTAEKFIDWHHPDAGCLRLYKTGDLGRCLRDGNIEFLGRLDEQVKIRGYRVEPGEIEVLLNHQPDIRQAVVVVREDQTGEKKLVAYLVSADGKRDQQQLRQSIEKQLPGYMMPSAFVWMDELPKTSSGKIDKKRLPKPERKRPALSVLYYSPTTTMEKEISSVWATMLEQDKVGLNDNFFELGGNSLLALKVVAELKRLFQYNLPVTKLYQYPTVSGILHYLEPAKNILVKDTEPVVQGTDIAVIAMACRFPGANTIDEYWSLLENGREAISFFSPEELDASIPEELKRSPDYIKARGIIDHAEEFDAEFFAISPRLAELMDPQQRVFLEIAWEALESGGYLPSKYAGMIGVFAGTGNNGYYINNVYGHTELINRQGSFQVMTVNEKDYIASRIAYTLNLTGPAVSVQSACSTSLLAIAEAVESIRKGQCELALAGGVSITVPIKSGQIYQEGGMFSSDGHNRSFDADASGTVFSDGAGIVLLKKLEDAVRDGDNIYAVIRGIGLNNDGGQKGSFTAPSAEGQSGAIQMAMHDAGVHPGQLSYIEAHGTATPLGDPIEIEGLQRAFGGQERKQYCAIGSVKSNIGHCTAAAGIAGFIKTSLALYHKKIPASIHYHRSNPHIHFEESPFYVNTELEDWDNENGRIAGVSSFGVGGTNVHVILEEFKTTDSRTFVSNDPESPFQLFILSAKTDKSLSDYSCKLANFLTEHESVTLGDLAYALQINREAFNKRRFIVAENEEELIRKLKTSGPRSHSLEEISNGVVFLFSRTGCAIRRNG